MHAEMEEFISILQGQDKSLGTIKNYNKNLEQFSDWLTGQSLEIEDVTPRDIQRYLAFLKNDRELASKTIRVHFAAISQFFKDITKTDPEFADPTEPVSIGDYAPPVTRKEEVTKEKHVWLTQDEMEELVENVPSPKLRNRVTNSLPILHWSSSAGGCGCEVRRFGS